MIPVPSSPEATVRPAALSAANAAGMAPVESKKLVSVLATFCWLVDKLPAGGGTNFSLIFKKALLAS